MRYLASYRFVILFVIGCLSLFFDEYLYQATLLIHTPVENSYITLFFLMYNPIFLFLLVSLTSGFYIFTQKQKPSETMISLMASLLLVILSTTFLKILFGRSRPFLHIGSMHFLPFSFQNSHYSLPSSHAAAAYTVFGMSSFFLCFMTVSLSLLRVLFLHHFISDIIFGWALAAGIESLVSIFKKKQGCKKC